MSRAPKYGRCTTCGRPKSHRFADAPVCSQACGHILALRLVEADPEVLGLLQPIGVYVRADLERCLALATALSAADERRLLISMAADVADLDPTLAIGHLDAALAILPGVAVLERAAIALATIPGAAP